MLATKLIHAHLNDNWPSLGTGRVRLPTLGFGKEQYFLSTDLIQKQTMLETNIDTKLQLLQMSLLLLNLLLLLLSLLSLLELWFLVQCLAVKDAAKQLSGMRIAIVCLGKLFFPAHLIGSQFFRECEYVFACCLQDLSTRLDQILISGVQSCSNIVTRNSRPRFTRPSHLAGLLLMLINLFGARNGLKMILSHRGPSNLNMSSYQTICTHFTQDVIFV